MIKEKLPLDFNDFTKKANEIHHGLYTYSSTQILKKSGNVNVICKKHGEFSQNLRYHLKGGGCRKCANEKLNITHDEFIHRANEIHKNNYDYKYVKFSKSSDKVTIICKKHGEFSQNVTSHLSGSGCIKCRTDNNKNVINMTKAIKMYPYLDFSNITYNTGKTYIYPICKYHGKIKTTFNTLVNMKRGCVECNKKNIKKTNLTNEEFMTRVIEKHQNKYDYTKTTFTKVHDCIIITCKEHGDFKKRAWSHLNGYGCTKCSNNGISKIEKSLIDEFDIDFIENDRSILNGKEIDLLYDNIGIEVNGLYWHSDKYLPKYYHLDKTKLAESKGIQLLHFWDTEVKDKKELVVSMIDSKLGLTENKIYARKCIIKEVSFKDAKTFLYENHLQGSGAIGKIRLGLYYNDNLVSIMTFSKPRFNKNYDYELIRFCNIIDTNVIGGASKLLKHFKSIYSGSIISYANRRFSNGKLYETLGFKLINETEPNYMYYKGNETLSRNQCQKHKLKDILKDFDNNLSEHENMLNNGYHRVYDCGNLVYVL